MDVGCIYNTWRPMALTYMIGNVLLRQTLCKEMLKVINSRQIHV